MQPPAMQPPAMQPPAMQPPAMQPPAITYPLIKELGATTIRQRNRVARQWEGEGTDALVAQIHVEEDAYAAALEAAD
jgi:hypothetical protein